MAVDFYDGSNNDGLFNLLGKAFYAQKLTDLHVGTTIPAEVVDIITSFRLLSVDMELQNSISGMVSAHDSLKASGTSLAGSLSAYCARLIIEMVHDDNPRVQKNLTDSLKELISQMKTASQTVDASSVTVTVTAGGSNTGTGVLVASTKRGYGLVQENSVAESIVAKCESAGTSLSLAGEASVGLLSMDWPKGSGVTGGLAGVATSIISNGDFENETDIANAPDGWQIPVGVTGTDLSITDVETQRIVLGGTPTGGTYKIIWSNANSKTEHTAPLAYNASSATVESEIRKFEGLSQATVATTGTTPNYTHDITFTGAGGNVNQFTSASSLTGGSPTITHSTTAAGASQVLFGSKSLKMSPDGSTLTTLQQELPTLSPSTAYAVNGWVLRGSSAISSGVLTVDLVDGIGGTVINDDQGTANSFTFNASSLTAQWKSLSSLVSGETVFRTPSTLPAQVYFRFRQSTAFDNLSEVYFSRFAMSEMTELYPGGPLAALFAGAVDFEVDDEITIAVTNDRAGELQEWYNRNFNMAGLGLLLPSHVGGSETIPDTVVS